MCNIIVLHTNLYLEYYFILLYIILKLYIQEKKLIILFFSHPWDKFLASPLLIPRKKIIELPLVMLNKIKSFITNSVSNCVASFPFINDSFMHYILNFLNNSQNHFFHQLIETTSVTIGTSIFKLL